MEKTLNRTTVLIEGILLLVVSFVSAAEGVRLIKEMDITAGTDILGPGYYILIISIMLFGIGLAHLLLNLKNKVAAKKVTINKETRMQVIGINLVLVIYCLLIYLVGYLAATVIFFLLQFRIAGVKSWPTNIILTLVLTGTFFLVFVKYCNMMFPQGILF